MLIYVVNAELFEKAGSESSIIVRGLVPARDKKNYTIFEKKNSKTGSYQSSLFIGCGSIEGGELIEAGDVIDVSFNPNGYVDSCRKIPDKRLSIQIVPVKNPDLNAGK